MIDFRRIKPKIRVSYSLYKAWVNNNWGEIFDYLTETSHFKSNAVVKGKQVHEWLEKNGLPDKLQKIVNEIDGYKIIDYKTGNLNGYASQVNCYAWLSKMLKPKIETRELKLEVEFDDFVAVGVIDHFIPGAKKGTAILAQVQPIIEREEIKEVIVTKTMAYEISDKWLMDWELIFEEVANSINFQIHQGKLDDYLRYYYF